MQTRLTIYSNSVEDAHASVNALTALVQEVLASNQEMAQRLANMELLLGNSLEDDSPKSDFGNNHELHRGSIPLVPKRRKFQRQPPEANAQIGEFGFTFDYDLKCSRVYARVRKSTFSLSSSARRSIGWSIFSGLSLADISDLSVISLPISAAELWNGERYGDL